MLLAKDRGTQPHPRSQFDVKAREPQIDIAEFTGSIPMAVTIGFSTTTQPVPAPTEIGGGAAQRPLTY